jgi:hypothetical protein
MNVSQAPIKLERGALIAHAALIEDPRLIIGLEEEFTEEQYVNYVSHRDQKGVQESTSQGVQEGTSHGSGASGNASHGLRASGNAPQRASGNAPQSTSRDVAHGNARFASWKEGTRG